MDYVADVMLSVCAALRACHQVGIIHRDLKPANIFLSDTDTGWEVKVLDFGISKAAMIDDLTKDGQILGTPQYLSPEQVDGQVGPESDQYAIGVLLYACLTQQLPYGVYENMRLLRAIQEGKFESPRTHRAELSERLEAIILRAMRVSVADRFESIHALGQALWEFASPRGQSQWKNFYFHTPIPGSGGAGRNATFEPQALQAMAAAAAQARAARAKPGAIDPTASLAEVRAFATTARLRAANLATEGLGATKTAARSRTPADTSQSDIAGESALSDASGANSSDRAARTKRWLAVLALAGAAAAGLVATHRPSPDLRAGRAPVGARSLSASARLRDGQ